MNGISLEDEAVSERDVIGRITRTESRSSPPVFPLQISGRSIRVIFEANSECRESHSGSRFSPSGLKFIEVAERIQARSMPPR